MVVLAFSDLRFLNELLRIRTKQGWVGAFCLARCGLSNLECLWSDSKKVNQESVRGFFVVLAFKDLRLPK